MKKILYIWKSPYPWDVRIEKICSSLADFGWDVTLLARWASGQLPQERIGNFNVIRAGANKSNKMFLPVPFNPVWEAEIHRTVLAVKPNIIMPREIMLAEPAARIAHKYNIPCIMDMAEHYPAAMKGWKKYSDNFLKRLIVHKLDIPSSVEKRSVAACDGIVTISDELKDRLIQKYRFDGDIELVLNTPSKDWFTDVRIGSANPPLKFAYHGHMTQDRNLDVLVKAFNIAAEKNPDITLTIAGAGEVFDECREIAASGKAASRIHFLGKYQHEQIKTLYSNTDIAVIPFKDNEFINHVIANKIFDYMAAGKPMIVSEAKPMKRIIEETAAGISVDCSNPETLSDAILNIGTQDLEKMSRSGIKAFNTKYNWDIDARNLNDFLESFV